MNLFLSALMLMISALFTVPATITADQHFVLLKNVRPVLPAVSDTKRKGKLKSKKPPENFP